MKRWIRFWPVGLGVLIPAPLFYVAALLANGGHGTYLPATIFFPVGMGISMLMHRVPIIAMVIAALQFPLYGYWFAKARQKRQFLKWLAIGHLALIFVAFLLDDGGVFTQL